MSTDDVAGQLRALGLSERALARELGVSASAARKLVTAGRTALRETAARALECAGASAHP